ELADPSIGALFGGEGVDQWISGDQELRQGPQLHDAVVLAIAGGGGPAIRLCPAAIRLDDRFPRMPRARVFEPGVPGVLADLSVVDFVDAAVEQNTAWYERPGGHLRIAVKTAAE